ncbi:anti-sigma F factor antagonist [Paenibacillus sp.]|uniref:anti-sigma F factor antagonist n=1 Tax=Paenibacillus sp. TaxID=58172 RepID=UPI002D4D4524|nr:anti-sigma F factor antagonist [Paenibacillus sp.]HZG55418.1 anti-sigma F factor antagonist [Paenibacillus sp.]
MSFGIHMEQHRQALIVRLVGELDHHAADSVRTQMEDAIVRGNVTHLILSLKDLTFMDSSGIGVILGRYKLITSRGGRMVVCDVSPPVYRLFEMSGLFKIVTIEQSEREALSSLGVVS